MTVLWLVAGAALLLAAAAWRQARAAVRRQQQLTEMYWELKYQLSELRQRHGGAPEAAPSRETPRPDHTIIPLSSLKS